MARFTVQGPRVSYAPVQSQKPFQQLIGLYGMWQALSPDTRNWIASLFKSKSAGVPTEQQTDDASDLIALSSAGLDPVLFNAQADNNIANIESPDDIMLQNRDAAMTWYDKIAADEGLVKAATMAGVEPVIDWRL